MDTPCSPQRSALRSAFALLVALAAVLALAAPAAAQDESAPADPGLTRLLRYPDIQGDTIAFVYAGDIWTVGADGGSARRLTSDPGQELFP
jgi:tricorn protease